ncbi:hypothetical protein [Cohnella sp. 56]|uniref:hypothetical protein n=1 Tax=Cohnella sp. 56 TaxID=3113722 RepID=UPI0030EAE1EB
MVLEIPSRLHAVVKSFKNPDQEGQVKNTLGASKDDQRILNTILKSNDNVGTQSYWL